MWTIAWTCVGASLGLFLGLLLASGKMADLQNQLKTKCDGCDYYQRYRAAQADCRALEEEIATMRRSYDNVRRVNKGLVRLTNARA